MFNNRQWVLISILAIHSHFVLGQTDSSIVNHSYAENFEDKLNASVDTTAIVHRKFSDGQIKS